MNDLTKDIIETAAEIATTGNGLPSEWAKELANHTLGNIIGYREHKVYADQDLDYLARMLEAVNWASSR